MMDLEQHLLRQMAFSRATFGPGARTAGVCDHIRKELVEVEAAAPKGPVHAAEEWVDVVILALDGLIRALQAADYSPEASAQYACDMIRRKQGRNECRNWPDWRPAPLDKAIEHTREGGEA